MFDWTIEKYHAVEKFICHLGMCNVFLVAASKKELEKKQYPFALDDVLKYIKHFSCTYNDVRKSKLKETIFYTKPYLRLERKDEYISISSYLSNTQYHYGLYWLVRDYYFNNPPSKDKQEFVNKFGDMFEDYIEEILGEFAKNKYEKLEEDDSHPRCDFKIELEDFILLIEAKSIIVIFLVIHSLFLF